MATHRQVGPPLDGYELAFSPLGRILATGGSLSAFVALWSLRTHKEIGRDLGGIDDLGVDTVVFSPNGRLLAGTGCDDTQVALWNVSTHRYLGGLGASLDEPFNSVAFGPSGRILATAGCYGDAPVRLWDLHTHKQRPLDIRYIKALAFGPDGRILATGATDGTIRLWNIARVRS